MNAVDDGKKKRERKEDRIRGNERKSDEEGNKIENKERKWEKGKRWIKQIHVGKGEVKARPGGRERLLDTPRASDKFSIGQILKERSPPPPSPLFLPPNKFKNRCSLE